MTLSPGENCVCAWADRAYVCADGEGPWCQGAREGEKGGCNNADGIICKNARGVNTGGLSTWAKGVDTGLECKSDLNCDYSKGKFFNYWDWIGDLGPGFQKEIDITNSVTTTTGRETSNARELSQELKLGLNIIFGDPKNSFLPEVKATDKQINTIKDSISNALNHSTTWKVTEGNLGGCGASVWQWSLKAMIDNRPECDILIRPPAMDSEGNPIFDFPSKHTVITHSAESPPCCIPGTARCTADAHNACFPDSPILCKDFEASAPFYGKCNKACTLYNSSTCTTQALSDYGACVPTRDGDLPQV